MANTKITSRVIADDAVLTANIADDAVTAAKLANDIAISTTGDLTVTSSTSNKPVVTIKNTNADANAPQLVFNKDSSSPADNDEVGRIYMYGDDDGGNAFEAVLIRGITTDVSNGSEDSTLEFFTQKAGSQTSTLTLASGNAGIGGAPATAAGISQYLTIYGGDSGIALKDSSANDTVELYNAGGKLYVYGGTGGSNGDRFQLDCVNTRLGIGTMSPSTNLHISGANDNTNGQLKITGTSGGDAQIAFLTDTNGRGMYLDDSDTNAFKIYGGAGKGSNEFVIDNSGNVGVRTTSLISGRTLDVRDVDGVTSFGVGNNAAYIQRGQTNNAAPPTLIFDGSNGSLASPTDVGDNKEIGRILFRGYHTNGFYTGASITAKVQAATGTNDMPSQIQFATSPDGSATPVQICVMYGEGQMHFKYFNSDSVRIYPQTDNAYDLGLSSYRFDDIFATNNTINTSDSREKTTLTALTTNEINASKALAKEFGTYKWLSAVSEKGSNARTHIGITAQKVKEIMEANSLDPTKYAFYCYDEWEAKAEEKDEETEQVIKPALEAGNRYGIRYSELHSFIVAGFNARLEALE